MEISGSRELQQKIYPLPLGCVIKVIFHQRH